MKLYRKASRNGGWKAYVFTIDRDGKTEFCDWLEKKLERPLIMKKASDLLNCYVGGTEHNIAAAFEEAKRENAVLLFDEIDSFLQDRRTANHSCRLRKSTKFLTQMESYEGYLVATTNLLDLMDNACLRRFDLKAKLDYMTDDQAEEMYRNRRKSGNSLSETK